MVRFVHKQLAYALVIGVSGLIAATVGVAVNGPVRLPGWWFIAAILAWGVFWGVASTSGLLKEGDLPLFRAAVPIADAAGALSAPAQVRLWLIRTYGMRLALWLPLGTALAVYEPLVVTFNLVWAVDPLMRAERAARWEQPAPGAAVAGRRGPAGTAGPGGPAAGLHDTPSHIGPLRRLRLSGL